MGPTHTTLPALLIATVVLLAGCRTAAPAYEQGPRVAVATVAETLRPQAGEPVLPILGRDSPTDDYLRYALLRNPQVAAAFYDWQAETEAITPARSLPDPQLLFQADITDTLMSVMPGVMFDFMGRGKRTAMGRENAAKSEIAYRVYASTVLATATAVRKAWVDLAFLDDALAIREQSAAAIGQAAAIAQAEYATGQGMATLEKQTNILNQGARLQTEIANLSDQRTAARAKFKATLGLRREETDPPWPLLAFPAAPPASEDVLWQQLTASNPEIATMRTMVEMAVAGMGVANRAGNPDFSAGLMADLRADPLMLRPTATLKLPIWRDKIDAIIASAEARKLAAEARLTATQITSASELAEKLFMVREADRMLSYLDTAALPNTKRALASAEAGYQAGMASLSTVAELRLMELDLGLERASLQRQREIALADLSLLVGGAVPSGGLLVNRP